MADLVAVMRDGRVVQCASPSALYSAPGDVGVATFVGEAVVLPAMLRDGYAETPLGRLAVRTTPACPAGASEPVVGTGGQVVIRPEQIAIRRRGDGLPARVLGTVFYGHDALVQLVLEGADVLVSSRTHGQHTVRDDDQVGVAVDGAVSFYPTSG